MTSEKRAQKFHSDDASLSRRVVTRHQYEISAVISQTSFSGKNRWWRREMSAVFLATIDNASGSEGSLKGL